MENILIAFRFLVAALIPDYPEWIEGEMNSMKNRVKQTKKIIDEKVIDSLILDESAPQKPSKFENGDEMDKEFADGDDDRKSSVELLEDVLSTLHNDRDLSSLLIPKL